VSFLSDDDSVPRHSNLNPPVGLNSCEKAWLLWQMSIVPVVVFILCVGPSCLKCLCKMGDSSLKGGCIMPNEMISLMYRPDCSRLILI
jgi:hypothetical protein